MLGNVLRGLGLRKKVANPGTDARDLPDFPAVRGDRDLAILGDVHGMVRPMERMLVRIEQHAPQAQVVCVGDLIDRGDESAAVLRLAFDCRQKLVVLLGNHEEMMLQFLDEPMEEAGRWFRNGGFQTLASFGIAPPGSAATPAEVTAVRDRLRTSLGDSIEVWLRGLPRSYLNGNIAVTHAGADPWVPISQQAARNLTWGHPDFGRRRRTDGMWVAHGHVIVGEGKAADGVISVDTGAFAGGGLTSALVSGGEVRFLVESS